MKRTIDPNQKFPCAACEEPTHWFVLKKDLCPRCHVLNVSKLDIVVTKGRTIH